MHSQCFLLYGIINHPHFKGDLCRGLGKPIINSKLVSHVRRHTSMELWFCLIISRDQLPLESAVQCVMNPGALMLCFATVWYS